eukprot:jgi/Botrbrau1/5279/Bobra.0172s0134.1
MTVPGYGTRLAEFVQAIVAGTLVDGQDVAGTIMDVPPAGAQRDRAIMRGSDSEMSSYALIWAWAALRCLPLACSSPGQAAGLCHGLLQRCTAALEGTPPDGPHAGALRVLVGASAQQIVEVGGSDSVTLPDLARQLLDLFTTCGSSFPLVSAAAAVASEALQAGWEPSKSDFQEVLSAVEGSLLSPSQPLRAATLRLLGTLAGPGDQIFGPLAAVEGGAYHQDGRKAEMALRRAGEAVEYNRVPPSLIRPVVMAVLGATYIKYQRLYSPIAEALASAMKRDPEKVWPLFFAELCAAQGAVLSGRGPEAPPAGRSPETAPSDPLWQRFQQVLAAGSVEAGGGCTAPGTRLETLLKVGSP